MRRVRRSEMQRSGIERARLEEAENQISQPNVRLAWQNGFARNREAHIKSKREGVYSIMICTMLKGKIHRATVLQAELDYVGSITIDEALMEASGIQEYEQVQIVDVNNGQRFETYVIAGERNSGMICLNGAAARQVQVGDKIIIMCYAGMTSEEIKEYHPKVVFVDEQNQIRQITHYEKHGRLQDMEEVK